MHSRGSSSARRGLQRSLRVALAFGGGGSGPFVPFLTHSCRSFYSAPSPPPPGPRLPLHHRCNYNYGCNSNSNPALCRRKFAASSPSPATAIPPPVAPNFFPFPHRRPFSTSTAIMAELQWPAARVRKTFLEYFEQRGHTIGTTTSLSVRARHTTARDAPEDAINVLYRVSCS